MTDVLQRYESYMKGRLDLCFKIPSDLEAQDSIPFQCKHTIAALSRTELQWDNCFHEPHMGFPVDVEIWWHPGRCTDSAFCPCQRSQYTRIHNPKRDDSLELELSAYLPVFDHDGSLWSGSEELSD
jgi:hypothetical protein